MAVKGPGVMTCYYNDEKATAEVLSEDGWLYTGDMAQEDEDGFIFLVDRKKDVIISGGENIYPVQIEDFLRNYTAIHDVAVIGLPDKRLGEITAAIIELKPDASCTEEEINAFCRKLPRYKRPRSIIFADIPRNPTGKIENRSCGNATAASTLWRHRTAVKFKNFQSQVCVCAAPANLTSAKSCAEMGLKMALKLIMLVIFLQL